MRLTCRIEGASALTEEKTRAIGHESLTIGRAAECGWVLIDPDRTLSKTHCRIDWTGDGYALTDLSTNGVFIGGRRQALGRGRTTPLSDGDVVTLGPYRVRIAIEAAPPPAPAPVLPEAVAAAPDRWIGAVPSAGFGQGMAPGPLGWDAPPDPARLGATGLLDDAAAPASRFAEQAMQGAATAAAMRVPRAEPMLPHDWDAPDAGNPHGDPHGNPRAGNPLGPPPRPAGAAEHNPAAWHIEVVAAFLEGAELDASVFDGIDHVTAFRDIGRIMRAATGGMRDLLVARTLAKAEFRMEPTMIQASDNNALKFSPDTDRALAAILGQAQGFLPGVASVEAGMRDVKAHELALVATISALLGELSAALSPAAIRGRVGDSGGMVPASRKARLWEEYERAFAEIQGGEPEPGQPSLLHRFALDYAAQVARSAA